MDTEWWQRTRSTIQTWRKQNDIMIKSLHEIPPWFLEMKSQSWTSGLNNLYTAPILGVECILLPLISHTALASSSVALKNQRNCELKEYAMFLSQPSCALAHREAFYFVKSTHFPGLRCLCVDLNPLKWRAMLRTQWALGLPLGGSRGLLPVASWEQRMNPY
jgi:hypothetical protein